MRTAILMMLVIGCGRSKNARSEDLDAPIEPGFAALYARAMEDMVMFPAGPTRAREIHCPGEKRTWEQEIADRKDKLLSHEAFTIDRQAVSCATAEACFDAGVCPHRPRCLGPSARLRPAEAERLCRWRGARLQTHLEWQRAIRGRDGFRLVANSQSDRLCPPYNELPGWPRCELVSDAGVRYYFGSLGEWVHDRCAGSTDRIYTRLSDLGDFSFLDDVTRLEFRCARSL